ncbi:MAG: extracellular solute-binding protein [Chloroflexota bacterium]|nr:MAG: extracellular solute-binding protein [Chloroflexota bacterium]
MIQLSPRVRPKALSRRSLLGASAIALLGAACARVTRLVEPPTIALRASGNPIRLWHAGGAIAASVMDRQLRPILGRRGGAIDLATLPLGDPEELFGRALGAAASGIGPDVLELPGEWLPEARDRGVIAAFGSDTVFADGWVPGLRETGLWRGEALGVPAAPVFAQPFYNDALLRAAGLREAGKATPPSTWAEYADVCKRVAAPEERWGAILPTGPGDDLYLHVAQHAFAAGAAFPTPNGGIVSFEHEAMRAALIFLQDLLATRGALPPDRPAFRLVESGKVGLWWASSLWARNETAIGSALSVGATLAPRRDHRGILLRGRHWCVGRFASGDRARELIAALSSDEASHAWCAGNGYPPARQNNLDRAPYRGDTGPFASLWPPILAQLLETANAPVTGFPGYRAVAGRLAGEFHLVLRNQKPIDVALAEGTAATRDILARS